MVMDAPIRKMLAPQDVKIPLTVPDSKREVYIKNYLAATRHSGRLLLFAGDQKIEHLNQDFYGKGIPVDCADPEYLFKIASKSRIGVFASHLGLIARYGADYKGVNYLIKLNGKTNIASLEIDDPISLALTSVEQVHVFSQNAKLPIVGVGYTVYLGSRYENKMLVEASRIIEQAHALGLLVVLWMYPRGKAISSERDAALIAGAAGVGVALGADFVKINPPDANAEGESAELLKVVVRAAGRTGVICSGGSAKPPRQFLEELYHQLHRGGTCGAAIGRNIYQRPYSEAIAFCEALAATVIDDKDVEVAAELLEI
jgi:fructose-bisphosphate aldolase/6-deoxy-5-ketofructose 1-phosphate synthase